MKKKIIVASATVLFAVATVFNMNLLQGNSLGDVTLDAIAVMAQAQTNGEVVVGPFCAYVSEDICYEHVEGSTTIRLYGIRQYN